MTLVIGNHRLYTLNPVFDEAGNMVELTIRVNRAIVDDVTGVTRSTLPTSQEISILSLLTPTQQAQAATLIRKVRDALPTLDYGD